MYHPPYGNKKNYRGPRHQFFLAMLVREVVIFPAIFEYLEFLLPLFLLLYGHVCMYVCVCVCFLLILFSVVFVDRLCRRFGEAC